MAPVWAGIVPVRIISWPDTPLLAGIVQPLKVFSVTADDGKGDDFGHFVTVNLLDHADDFGKQGSSGFDQQEALMGRLYLALPAKERIHSWNDVHAGRLLGIDQQLSNLVGFLFAGGGDQDDY